MEMPRSTPAILWIELTSRCPFRCVFCSRELLRGAGRHLDFTLYERLIADLDRPQLVRLNYSGESAHYPRVVEACRLAAQAGAAVELVTALAALPEAKLAPLVDSGLSRLTISLHTLDAVQFEAIYGFSTLASMRTRIEALAVLAARRSPQPLVLDFAFVAMQRNLDQLPAICRYARTLGIRDVAVHPVIRRDPIPETFPDELDAAGRLRTEFLSRLARAIEHARHDVPEVAITASTPELGPRAALTDLPGYHPWPLQGDARLHGCDQDPFETVHVLADGRVVSCEVRDGIELGRLGPGTGIRDVWNGEAYREFRRRFRAGLDEHCRRCPYKIAHRPAPAPRAITAGTSPSVGLGWGWHAVDADALWSRPQATFELDAARRWRAPVLRGRLPPGTDGTNVLTVSLAQGESVRITNATREALDFAVPLPVVRDGRATLAYHLEVSSPHRPQAAGDARVLGIALTSVE